MHKFSYTISCLLVFVGVANSQQTIHLNTWGRLSVSQPLGEKWRTELEFQHRQQNDAANQKYNPFQNSLLTSVRTWMHFQAKENILISVSPFAYFRNNPVIINQTDKGKPPVNEFRFTASIELKNELAKNLWIIDRTCIEYRNFQSTVPDIIRIRNRFGFRYEFNHKWNIALFDEVFLNASGTKSTHIFDQNRIGILLNYKPSTYLKLEVGYMYATRLLQSADDISCESNIILNVYFILPKIKGKEHTKN